MIDDVKSINRKARKVLAKVTKIFTTELHGVSTE